MMKQIFHIPGGVDEQDKRRIHLLRLMLALLPVSFVFFILTRIHVKDYLTIYILSASLLLICISLYLGLIKKLQPAVFFMALTLLLTITSLSTLGQGIHDVSIVGYPAVLIIASLVLTRPYFITLTLISLISIAWLVFGAMFQIFITKTHDPGAPSDFVVVGIIMVISALFTYVLSDGQRRSLEKANREIEERQKVEAELQKSVQDQVALLHEVHHRVKNNLAIINSLLNLQEKMVPGEPKNAGAFQDIRNRIVAMSLVHEQLYKSKDFAHINMSDYIENLTSRLSLIFNPQQRILIKTDVENITLSIDSAIPCGILLNEIVTNAFKHAFHEGEQGEIRIRMKCVRGRCVLSVADTGPGFSDIDKAKKSKSLGLHLIEMLTEQLEGKLDMRNDQGLHIEIAFPVK